MLADLIKNEEMKERVEKLFALASPCRLCPRECNARRAEGETGRCKAGKQAAVASVCSHHGEEPVISGAKGSGAIFFMGCNLRCLFCQNHQISRPSEPLAFHEVNAQTLAGHMLRLQDTGVHNINLVSPTHFTPQIAEALMIAGENGLALPVVYNTNAYDSLEALKLLDGMIDIYMPDMKYSDATTALKLSNIREYPRHAQAALKEMYRQVGGLQLNGGGVAVKGLLVRHLVLPNGFAGSQDVMRFIARELGDDVYVSLMAQYHPSGFARRHPQLNRRINRTEYREALSEMKKLDIGGFTQDIKLSPDNYLPDFNKERPFE